MTKLLTCYICMVGNWVCVMCYGKNYWLLNVMKSVFLSFLHHNNAPYHHSYIFEILRLFHIKDVKSISFCTLEK